MNAGRSRPTERAAFRDAPEIELTSVRLMPSRNVAVYVAVPEKVAARRSSSTTRVDHNVARW